MRNVVLIACPDTERTERLLDLFDAAGFQCLTAASGSEALATAAGYSPQLAVLHVDLPEVQGTDVCLRLKQETSTERTAVLLIGKDTREERFIGSEVGADAYLVEPYEDAELIEKVRGLFSKLVLNAR